MTPAEELLLLLILVCAAGTAHRTEDLRPLPATEGIAVTVAPINPDYRVTVAPLQRLEDHVVLTGVVQRLASVGPLDGHVHLSVTDGAGTVAAEDIIPLRLASDARPLPGQRSFAWLSATQPRAGSRLTLRYHRFAAESRPAPAGSSTW